jgi:L-cysteine:1D-myo-inositol 2-amino-2-deoxy-alpha-D-glucopyranoside ligase
MMHLFDTARGAVLPLEAGPTVTIYACGITPYDAAHLGHAATYLTFDVLRRRLSDLGHETRCVRNVTDVDDDILRRARELGVHYLDLAAEEMVRFDKDMAALGLLPANAEPRATSAIPDILSLVDALLESGHAYRARTTGGDAVYFDMGSSATFGSVSHLGRDEMIVLAGERGGNPEDPGKRDPLDWVLWQPSARDEPSWESRYGPGRPGWHVECSALAMRELGPTVDIHGGGSDLIFPHHECEAAQSQAVTGKPLSRHWVHVGMIGLEGTKMSKSLGNLVFVSELLEEWEPEAIRLALLEKHYREDRDWQHEALERAAARVESWRSAGSGDRGLEQVRARLDDDLDTPGAIAAIDEAAASGGVSQAAALLGVTL